MVHVNWKRTYMRNIINIPNKYIINYQVMLMADTFNPVVFGENQKGRWWEKPKWLITMPPIQTQLPMNLPRVNMSEILTHTHSLSLPFLSLHLYHPILTIKQNKNPFLLQKKIIIIHKLLHYFLHQFVRWNQDRSKQKSILGISD